MLKTIHIRIITLLLSFCAANPALAQQYMIYSEQCAAGNGEAQRQFRQAQDHRFGRGVSLNIEFAKSRYNEALLNGSARALVDLGTMAEDMLGLYPNNQEYKQEALKYYTEAAAQGCPEGTYKLYLWDSLESLQNPELSHDFPHPGLLQAAEGGAMAAMHDLGNQYLRHGNTEQGEKWLKQALELGWGDAALPYSRLLFERNQIREGMEALLSGARLGSIQCLKRLAWIYSRGRYKQVHDPAHAECLLKVADGIKASAPPDPIRHLDQICPPRQIMIY